MAETMESGLHEIGFSDKFINSLTNAMYENLIKKGILYSREGIVETAYCFVGLFEMFDYRLSYGPTVGGAYDNINHLGVGFEKQNKMKFVDCCNLFDWLCRCNGIDAYAYGASTHYKYGKDIEGYANPTPEDEYYARSDSKYFTQGKPGDIVETNERGHLRVIIENDGNGYLMVESEGDYGLVFKYYTYDELASDIKHGSYHVSNMDAVYRNTTSGKIGMFRDTYGDPYNRYYHADLDEAKRLRGEGIFISPAELSKSLNLSDENTNEVYRQYNLRNENPHVNFQNEILDEGMNENLSGMVIPDLEQVIVNKN